MVDTRMAKNKEELKDIMELEYNHSILASIKQDIISIEWKMEHLKAQLERLNREKSRAEKSISKYYEKYNNDPYAERIPKYGRKRSY